MKYRWECQAPLPEGVHRLAAELGISELLAQCLLNRNIGEIDAVRRFLEPRLKFLSDPFQVPGMVTAVKRLYAARTAGERVILFGDYDVDGVTTTALLQEVLEALGWEVRHYLPSRVDAGYGLTPEGVQQCLQEHGPGLLLAVDCGSTATEVIGQLQGRGIEVIVLDHHQIADPPPPAVALVNPRCAAEEDAPFLELCSVGLAFKLAHGLVKEGRTRGLPEAHRFDVRDQLDLVAVGTVADLVPLTGENRVLVSRGLELLSRTSRPGLRALKLVARTKETVGVVEVGFHLAPRLNAAGRLQEATEALDLLMARDLESANHFAARLDDKNQERQRIERAIAEEAVERVRQRFDPNRDWVIVEGSDDWHIGVVGIVAARVLKEFGRPTIIMGAHNGEWRGSGRSVFGYDLAAALRTCDSLLIRHGGHAMAAGLSILKENADALRIRLNEHAAAVLSRGSMQPELVLDGQWPLAEFTVDRVRELQRLEPVGQGNRAVQVMCRHVWREGAWRRIGREGKHASFSVADGSGSSQCICWNYEQIGIPEGIADIAVAPQINEFRGRATVQLRLLDWRAVVAD